MCCCLEFGMFLLFAAIVYDNCMSSSDIYLILDLFVVLVYLSCIIRFFFAFVLETFETIRFCCIFSGAICFSPQFLQFCAACKDLIFVGCWRMELLILFYDDYERGLCM